MSCAKADSCSHFREVESENLRDVCDVMKAGFSAHQNPVAKDDSNKMCNDVHVNLLNFALLS